MKAEASKLTEKQRNLLETARNMPNGIYLLDGAENATARALVLKGFGIIEVNRVHRKNQFKLC